MRNTFSQHFWPRHGLEGPPKGKVHGRFRLVWDVLGHLCVMDSERISGLGLEPMLTTSELAEYLGVQAPNEDGGDGPNDHVNQRDGPEGDQDHEEPQPDERYRD